MSEGALEEAQTSDPAAARPAASAAGVFGAVWGLAGLSALLLYAVYRLTGMTIAAFAHDLDWRHWALLIVNSAFMAHAEGYRGFQKGYSPRVVARALHLMANPVPSRVIFAPLFVMGYFATTRRRLISTYLLTAMIVALIIAFQQLSQPWRGMLDFGVVIGLTWGLASTAVFALRAFTGAPFDHSPELPQTEAA